MTIATRSHTIIWQLFRQVCRKLCRLLLLQNSLVVVTLDSCDIKQNGCLSLNQTWLLLRSANSKCFDTWTLEIFLDLFLNIYKFVAFIYLLTCQNIYSSQTHQILQEKAKTKIWYFTCIFLYNCDILFNYNPFLA